MFWQRLIVTDVHSPFFNIAARHPKLKIGFWSHAVRQSTMEYQGHNYEVGNDAEVYESGIVIAGGRHSDGLHVESSRIIEDCWGLN